MGGAGGGSAPFQVPSQVLDGWHWPYLHPHALTHEEPKLREGGLSLPSPLNRGRAGRADLFIFQPRHRATLPPSQVDYD